MNFNFYFAISNGEIKVEINCEITVENFFVVMSQPEMTEFEEAGKHTHRTAH